MHADAKWLKTRSHDNKLQVASRQIGGQPNLQMIHIVYQLMTVYTTCVYGEEGPVPTRDAQ